MDSHYCEVHNCKFFENQGKDGKPNWWSHKVQGTNPAQYCNEKKKKETPVQTPPPPARVVPADEVEKIFTKPNPAIPVVGTGIPQRSGQEIGMWWKELGDMIRASKASSDFENAYWLQMETVLGLQKKPARDKSVDQKMLYSLIKSHMHFKTDESVESWLENVAKIDMSRIESEPDKVFTEIEKKQGWDK